MSPEDDFTNSKIEHLLHQANLQRLRGDLDLAQIQCMEVLAKSPNQADALALLGDVKYEAGDLQDAVHWYGLALAESPSRPGLPEKLARAQSALRSEEQEAGAAQIGLPTRPAWPVWALPASLVVAALAVGTGAYFAGTKNAPPTVFREPISVPAQPTAINAEMSTKPASGPAVPTNADEVNPTATTGATPAPTPPAATPPEPSGQTPTGTEDFSRVKTLPNFRSLVADPRTQGAAVAFLATDAANLAAETPTLIAQIFDRAPGLDKVTLRFENAEGAPLYIADFTRDNPTKPQNEWTAPVSTPPAQ